MLPHQHDLLRNLDRRRCTILQAPLRLGGSIGKGLQKQVGNTLLQDHRGGVGVPPVDPRGIEDELPALDV